MSRKKSRLSSRKNCQSAAHIARAKARKLKKEQMILNTLTGAITIDNENNDVSREKDLFEGFDCPPILPSLKVLSLFDGIGTALQALDNLGLYVEAYLSSEIDEKAIKLQKYNFGKRVTPLGSVTSLCLDQLSELKIDLLIGGSPCTDLSLVNPGRRGLHGHGSTGRLFFDYIKIRNFLQRKAEQDGSKLWWLFENTFHSEKNVLAEMSRCLGCQPTVICASKFLPVIRRRNFLGNIPALSDGGLGVHNPPFELSAILMPYRLPDVSIIPTLTTNSYSQRSGKKILKAHCLSLN